MVVWRGVQSGCGVFIFKSAIELIQIVCLLLIIHSVIMDSPPFHTDAESLEENWILSLSE